MNFKLYVYNNLAIISHLLNTLLGGKHDHTLSSRVGFENHVEGRWFILGKCIDKVFGEEHCLNEYKRTTKRIEY